MALKSSFIAALERFGISPDDIVNLKRIYGKGRSWVSNRGDVNTTRNPDAGRVAAMNERIARMQQKTVDEILKSKIVQYPIAKWTNPLAESAKLFPWRKYDFVGNRASPVFKTTASQTSAIVPFDPIFAEDQKERYGLNAEAERLPRIRSALKKRKSVKDSQREFDLFMMSDKDRFIQEKIDSGQSYRNANLMWIRKEFGNGVLAKIAKSNPKVADNLIKLNKGLQKSPFLGAFVRHPLIAGMSVFATTALQYGTAIARASKESVKILNSERLLGGISGGEFSGGATAGFDFLTTLRALGGVTANVAGWKYGEGLQGLYKAAMYGMDIAGWNPFMGRDEMLKWAIPQLDKLPEGDRKKAADALGISEVAFNIGKNNLTDPMFMTNEQLIGAMWQNTLNERRKKRTSGNFVTAALSFLNPFESDTFGESLNALFFHRPTAYNLIEKMRATQEAASSVGSYSAGGMSQSLAGGDTDNSTTMYIDKMVLPNATDADGIKRDAKSESSRYVSRLRTVKRISTGVR